MSPDETPAQRLLEELQERAKELSCLYTIDEMAQATNPSEVVTVEATETRKPDKQRSIAPIIQRSE